MKKIIALIVICLLQIMPLSSYGKEKILRLASWMDPNALDTRTGKTPMGIKKFTELIKEFENKSGITVKMISLPSTQIENQLMITNQAGKPFADVVLVAGQKLAFLVRARMIKSLDSLVKRDFTEEDLADFQEVEKNVSTYKNKRYLFLNALHSRFMYYNKNLIKTPPKSWDELVKIGKELSDPAKKIYGFSAWLNEEYSAIEGGYASLIWGAGGRIADDKGYLAINTPEVLKALKFVREIIYEDQITPKNALTGTMFMQSDLFARGKIGMVINGNWMLEGYLRETEFGRNGKLGIAAIPSPDGKGSPIFTNGWGWAIPSKIDKEHTEYAWEFIKFITSSEIQRYSFEFDGGLPVRKSSLNNLNANPHLVYYKTIMNIFNKYGRSMDPLKNYEKELETAVTTFHRYLAKPNMSDEEAMKLLNRVVQSQ